MRVGGRVWWGLFCAVSGRAEAHQDAGGVGGSGGARVGENLHSSAMDRASPHSHLQSSGSQGKQVWEPGRLLCVVGILHTEEPQPGGVKLALGAIPATGWGEALDWPSCLPGAWLGDSRSGCM